MRERERERERVVRVPSALSDFGAIVWIEGKWRGKNSGSLFSIFRQRKRTRIARHGRKCPSTTPFVRMREREKKKYLNK